MQETTWIYNPLGRLLVLFLATALASLALLKWTLSNLISRERRERTGLGFDLLFLALSLMALAFSGYLGSLAWQAWIAVQAVAKTAG